MKKAVVTGLSVVVLVALVGGYAMSRRDAGLAGAGAASSAGSGVASASGPAAGASGPPVSVTLVRAQQRDVDVLLDATGTVTALNSVDIRPQVASIITKVHIREGQFVSAGQLLFTLDSRNDEVNVTRAQAQLAKDTAALADSQRQLARSKDLFAQNFISQGAVDTTQTLVDSQLAVVASDRAAIQAAQVGLSYSRISATAAGRAGAINVFAGSTVQPSGPSLVTITQLNPIAVSFSLPQRNLGDALQTLRSGGGKVAAILPEGRGTLAGRLQFVDNAVDAGSGTVRVKAQFDNPDEKLWPGAFVGVRLAVRTLKDAIVIPQAAVIQAPRAKIVYVVEAGGKAAPRRVELVYATGEDAVVTGVGPSDRIVVDGKQNLRPGSRVVERAAGEGGGRGRRGASSPAGGAAAAGSGASSASGAAGLASPLGAAPAASESRAANVANGGEPGMRRAGGASAGAAREPGGGATGGSAATAAP